MSSESQCAIRNAEVTAQAVQSVEAPADAVPKEDGDKRCVGWCCQAVAKADKVLENSAAYQDEDSSVKATLRELAIYCCFLALLTVVAFGTRSISMYNYTQTISGIFLNVPIGNDTTTFASMNSIKDWWTFANSTLLDGVFGISNSSSSASVNSSAWEPKPTIYYESVLLGVAQIRQVRVSNRSCRVAQPFRDVIGWCYGPYSSWAEDKNAFGSGRAWTYQSSDSLDGSTSYSGSVGTYDGGGYRVLLQPNRSASEQILSSLYHGLWLDRGTRAVFIDFTVYNPNVNLFCVARLIAEIPATGGVVTSWEFRSLKLLRYAEPFDYFIAACECCLLALCCYYTVQEVMEIRRQRLAYLKVLSNWLDLALLIVCYVCAGFNIYRIVAISEKLQQLLSDALECPNFVSLSYWQTCFNHAIAMAVFLAWIKLFKYVRFSRTLTMLNATLGSCAKDLLAFCIIFFIIFFAFALLGNLVFGTQVDDFQDFQQSVFTLFRIILGDVNFDKMQQANRVIGPVYFLLYVFFVFFILLNMFLAIINEKFGEVKAENEYGGGRTGIDVARFLRRRADKLLNKLSARRRKVLDIQRAVLHCGDEATLSFEGWRKQLRPHGFADAEIEALFAKYDADGDQALSVAERMQMRCDLEGERSKLDQEIAAEAGGTVSKTLAPHEEESEDEYDGEYDEEGASPPPPGRSRRSIGGVSRDDLAFLTRRVDRLEVRVSGALNGIDRVLMSLERLERLKLQRRTALYRLLALARAPSSSAESPSQTRIRLEDLIRAELRLWGSTTAPGTVTDHN